MKIGYLLDCEEENAFHVFKKTRYSSNDALLVQGFAMFACNQVRSMPIKDISKSLQLSLQNVKTCIFAICFNMRRISALEK
jgi:hypothetical protein